MVEFRRHEVQAPSPRTQSSPSTLFPVNFLPSLCLFVPPYFMGEAKPETVEEALARLEDALVERHKRAAEKAQERKRAFQNLEQSFRNLTRDVKKERPSRI
ncbi:hypothetical protein FS749_004635 [Ceratobasidium sp. UAMH 11750]|nr:hypothetical protein FS749_004635 [Ceratobasidium sp. UAMH 11750]